MIPIVTKLDHRNIAKLVKCFERMVSDPVGTIRANTTICCSRIADKLPEAQRKQLLGKCFSKACADSFAVSRRSALSGLACTHHVFSPAELATSLMPIVSRLMVDPEAEVRALAFQCAGTLVLRLQTHSQEMAIAAAEAAARAADAPDRGDGVSAVAPESTSSAGGWISGLSGMLGRRSSSSSGSGSSRAGAAGAAAPHVAPAGGSSAAVAAAAAPSTRASSTLQRGGMTLDERDAKKAQRKRELQQKREARKRRQQQQQQKQKQKQKQQ